MKKTDKSTEKIRAVNKNFYNLPPKDKDLIIQSRAGNAFDMSQTDSDKQAEKLD